MSKVKTGVEIEQRTGSRVRKTQHTQLYSTRVDHKCLDLAQISVLGRREHYIFKYFPTNYLLTYLEDCVYCATLVAQGHYFLILKRDLVVIFDIYNATIFIWRLHAQRYFHFIPLITYGIFDDDRSLQYIISRSLYILFQNLRVRHFPRRFLFGKIPVFGGNLEAKKLFCAKVDNERHLF